MLETSNQIMQNHSIAQVAAADAEQFGGLAFVAPGVRQGAADQVLFGLGQGGY
jgi:hypothetical protein